MFEIDKKEFGSFIAQLRKEQDLTQKELAEKLFLSDKAVSKWETGYSIPDTTLLVPLAEILGVTVTELLECRRSEKSTLAPEEAEVLVQKALSFTEETARRPDRRKGAALILTCALLAALEDFMLFTTFPSIYEVSSILLVMYLLPLIFSVYFWCFIPEALPRYYDENRITAYSDGVFRMNLVGIAINNRNWPYIVKTGRVWTLFSLTGTPLLLGLAAIVFPDRILSLQFAVLLLVLGGLFLPMMLTAKKYES